MSFDLAHFVENLLASWFGHGEAQISSTAISQAVSDAGYDPSELKDLDMGKIYQNACQHPGVPAYYADNAQNYQGSGDFETVVRQIQQVTEVHNTQQFFDNSTNVDNSIDLSGSTVSGGLDIHNTNITADDGGVAAGGDVNGAATGDGAEATGSGNIQHAEGGVLIGGDNNGIANSGDQAAIVDQGVHLQGQPGYIIDPVRTLDPGYGGGEAPLTRLEGVDGIATAPHPSPVILNTGNNATQQVAQVGGAGNQTNFGDGDNTNLPGANLTGSSVGHDGVGTFNNDQFTDSQVGVAGGPQHQEFQDDSQHSYVDNHDSTFSPVDTEQGPGNQDVHHPGHDQMPDPTHIA